MSYWVIFAVGVAAMVSGVSAEMGHLLSDWVAGILFGFGWAITITSGWLADYLKLRSDALQERDDG